MNSLETFNISKHFLHEHAAIVETLQITLKDRWQEKANL